MIHRIFGLLMFLSACPLLAQDQALAIGEWRVHLPQSNVRSVAQVNSEVYAGVGDAHLFTYNLEDNSTRILSGVQGYSDIDVVKIRYHEALGVLVIAYKNANIDLVKNGTIVNIPFIKNELILGDKVIKDIHFIGELAYLSTGFGIVVIDLVKEEVKESYNIGANGDRININQISDNGSQIMAATSDGVYVADLNSSFLESFNSWTLYDEMDGIELNSAIGVGYFAGSFFAAIGGSLYRYFEGQWWAFYMAETDREILHLGVGENQMVLTEYRTDSDGKYSPRLIIFDTALNFASYNSSSVLRPVEAVPAANNTIWVADEWLGLIELKDNVFKTQIKLNSPRTNDVSKLMVHNNALYLSPGGVTQGWNARGLNSGFIRLQEGFWDNFHRDQLSILDSVNDVILAVAHPSQNKIYLGSYGGGLVELGANDEINIYKQNSSLQLVAGDANSYRVSGLAFDSQENLWISNYKTTRPISVFTKDGEWQSFAVPIGSIDTPIDVIVDRFDRKWFIEHQDGGILLYDSGDDILSKDDDSFRWLKNAEGEGSLPSNSVFSLVEDKDGEIWVGTSDGIGIFSCGSDVFTNGCEAIRPIVEVGDELGYLMQNEIVRAIAVDDGNRKWVGTDNGLWLLSEDGREQLAFYNASNSPLLSNSVNSIAINRANGEIFVGTNKGVVSFRGQSVQGGAVHGDVLVFPNPVRPEYEGDIAISGLVDEAIVKITDISGHMIYETRALGGQAIWDGKNYNGSRAATGVYLVFSSDDEGAEKFVTKLFLVN